MRARAKIAIIAIIAIVVMTAGGSFYFYHADFETRTPVAAQQQDQNGDNPYVRPGAETSPSDQTISAPPDAPSSNDGESKSITKTAHTRGPSPAAVGRSPEPTPIAPPTVEAPSGAVEVPPKSPPKQDADASCRNKLLARGVFLLPTDPCVDIDELIKRLTTGIYKFNKPETAYVEEPFRLVLTLQTAKGQDVTSAFQGTSGNIVERSAPLAQHLEATLRGGLDFRVDPPGPQERTVTSSAPVIWEWTVVPLNGGKKTIVIDVAANLIVSAEKEHVQLRTLYEEIQINVGFLHVFVSAFSSLWGIGLGLATMIMAVLGVIHYLPSKKRGAAHHKQHSAPQSN